MNQEKKKLPNSYNIIFPFLLLIATLFMGIGYAAINSITADITGLVLANSQEGIFITEVQQSTDSNDSKINTYHQKMLSTKVVLDALNPASYVTYNVTVYNNTNENYVLTGATFDELFYTDDNNDYNSDIIFELTREGELLLPHDNFTFQITFKYNNDVPVQNVLNSYISFVFKKAYSVTYINVENSSYPTFIIENDTLVVDMSDASYSSVIVKIANNQITNYTYENNILTIPNVTGNVSIEGIIGKYIVTFDTNMNLSQYVSTIGFTIVEQTEADGNYYRASFNKTTGTTDEWYRIVFPSYSYNVGSTYRIRIKTRVQSAVLDFAEVRHAAIDNDWGTEGRKYIQFTADAVGVWNEQILTRSFNSATIWQGGVEYQVSPRPEIYTSNLTLAGGITSRSLTFDYKDVYVGEISTLELDYGSKLGTLPTPSRDGYLFKGWYTEPEGGTRISPSTIVTENNTIYYAQWVSADEQIYSVTYTNIESDNYPTFVVANETLVVDMSDNSYDSIVVKIDDKQIEDYTYENYILTIPNVTGNVSIEAKNMQTQTFSETILANNTLITAKPTLTTSSNNTSDVSGLYKSTDTNDEKPTYYFRGNVENNYVSFAGFTWRVVRINEDGTIRLVMTTGLNNRGYNFNANYTGLDAMYFSNTNIANSAKYVLNDWYNTNLSNYSNYIASGNYYCEQAKVKLTPGLSSGNVEMELAANYIPNFKCETDNNGYGIVNSNIGLLTYDEIVYAGGYWGQANNKYFLYNSSNFWTMSSAGVAGGAYEWFVDTSGNINYVIVADGFELRPVINLKADVIVTGSGTSEDPWMIGD